MGVPRPTRKCHCGQLAFADSTVCSECGLELPPPGLDVRHPFAWMSVIVLMAIAMFVYFVWTNPPWLI